MAWFKIHWKQLLILALVLMFPVALVLRVWWMEQPVLSIYRVSDGKAILTIRGHRDAIISIAYSPDGKLIASASWDGSVRLWSASNGRCQGVLDHLGQLNSVEFSPDGKLLAFGSEGRSLGLIRVSDLKLIKRLGDHYGAWSVRFTPDGRFVACIGRNGVEVFDIKNGRLYHLLEDDGSIAIALSPDGRMLATGGYGPGAAFNRYSQISLWSMPDYKYLYTYKNDESFVTRLLSFSPDGKMLASAGEETALFEVRNGKLLRMDVRMQGLGSSHQVAFSPSGKLLAATAGMGFLFRISDGKQLYTMYGYHASGACSVKFSPDGRFVALGTFKRTK